MPITKNKSSKREQIINEATKLFKEKGYTRSSMRDLAERVGMEAASMYNHIRSKDEILEAICFEMAEKYDQHFDELETLEIGYAEKIEALIAFHVKMIIENTNAVSVLNNDWKYLDSERISAFKEMRNAYEKRFADLINQGIKNGSFKPVNASVALFTILSSLRWVELWYKPGRNISKETLAKDISLLLMNGVKA